MDVLLAEVIRPGIDGLITTFINENLSTCSDITYNLVLASYLVSLQDFQDLLSGPVDAYVIRKHVRSIMRMYVNEVNRARPIRVSDRVQFGIQMETVGLNIGRSSQYNSESRSILPDGNVIVLSILSLCMAYLLFKSRK